MKLSTPSTCEVVVSICSLEVPLLEHYYTSIPVTELEAHCYYQPQMPMLKLCDKLIYNYSLMGCDTLVRYTETDNGRILRLLDADYDADRPDITKVNSMVLIQILRLAQPVKGLLPFMRHKSSVP